MLPDELAERIDSYQTSELLAYFRLHPLPDQYWQTGLICSTMANVMGDGKRHFKPEDFMPRVKRRMTDEQMWGCFAGFLNGGNGC